MGGLFVKKKIPFHIILFIKPILVLFVSFIYRQLVKSDFISTTSNPFSMFISLKKA